MELTAILFCCVYLALAVGHLPGFRLDRTGAVVVGAMLLITLGRITPEAAWHAVDYRTIGLLFGLMVMSSAFSVAGFYRWVAARVGSLNVKPAMLLALLIAVTGALSALLTNDVVAVAMTPMLISICLVRGLNPVPFVLGFCFATNIGGAATLIGSPQNMVVAEMLDLSFTQFTRATALPALLGLPVIWGVVVMIYRGRWHLPGVEAVRGAAASAAAPAVGASMSSETAQTPAAPAPAPAPVVIHLDVPAAVKASLVTTAVIVAFIFTDWPHVLIALGGASLLLISRHVESRDLLREVDGSLLLLLMGLFIVNMAMSSTGLPQQLIAYARNAGLDLHSPMSMLFVMAVLSNVVGNNPAVMLAGPFMQGADDPVALGAAIALGTGLSSNALIFGSLAGVIVAEESRQRGVILRFGDFARVGFPVAIVSLLLAWAWVALLLR